MSDTDPVTPAYYAAHAGLVVFPRSSADLSNTTLCPACFSPLTSVVCGRCGLDLGHPAAAKLASVSASAASALAERLELIGRIRYETAERERLAAAQSVAQRAADLVPVAVRPAMTDSPAIAAGFPLAPPLAPSAIPQRVAPSARAASEPPSSFG